MNQRHETAATALPDATRATRTATVLGALLVIMLGVFLLYGAGFAQPEALHKAAHDGRHAFALPCH